jgi:tetrapyrrole methylase family protein/MazG family protein
MIRKIYYAPERLEKTGRYNLEVQLVNNQTVGERFAELLDVMARLRGENGCPWDREQTHASLKSFLIEESYELLSALESGDGDKIREELGDLLHQIVFHCQIAAESGAFTAQDVVSDLKEKMIRRHPHVFSGTTMRDTDAVLRQWAQMKAKESEADSAKSALGNLPKSMPALARAQTITERASHLGFDWPKIDPVWEKIDEEISELRTACASGDKQRMREELGDLFFSLVNLARFLGMQAEDALSQSTARFLKRFTYIEAKLREAGKTPATSSLEEMDRLWDEVKQLERQEKAQT